MIITAFETVTICNGSLDGENIFYKFIMLPIIAKKDGVVAYCNGNSFHTNQ
jgi:hypothetical protein